MQVKINDHFEKIGWNKEFLETNYPRGTAIEVFPASPAGGRSFHFDLSGQKSKF